jgi:hypothetical protein
MEKLETNYDNCYVRADGEIIAGCIDGRCGCKNRYPNSAGGSLSLYVATRLCGYDVDERQFYADLVKKGYPLGAHIDQHANDVKTGCGANDRLGEILNKLADEQSRTKILNQMESLTKIDRLILDEIGALATHLVLGTPRERLAAVESAGGVVETLTGDHEETEILINTVVGTTLDRTASGGRAFNVDVWAFESSARAALEIIGQSADNEAVNQFVTTLIAFNLATGTVLNPTAKIIIRR